MTIFYLVRHGTHGLLDKVMAGRMAGVHLNEVGIAEAEALGDLLSAVELNAIYASPLERAQETAAPLAKRLGLAIGVEYGLHELDFGDWTGCAIDLLRCKAEWQRFNSFRSGSRPPGGETIAEVQVRMVVTLEQLSLRHSDGRVAIFGHADPIKCALAFYVGAPLDFIQRLDIRPGTVSVLELHEWGPRILQIGAGIDAPAKRTSAAGRN